MDESLNDPRNLRLRLIEALELIKLMVDERGVAPCFKAACTGLLEFRAIEKLSSYQPLPHSLPAKSSPATHNLPAKPRLKKSRSNYPSGGLVD